MAGFLLAAVSNNSTQFANGITLVDIFLSASCFAGKDPLAE